VLCEKSAQKFSWSRDHEEEYDVSTTAFISCVAAAFLREDLDPSIVTREYDYNGNQRYPVLEKEISKALVRIMKHEARKTYMMPHLLARKSQTRDLKYRFLRQVFVGCMNGQVQEGLQQPNKKPRLSACS